MKILYFTHSLLSCWNHGNAHFLRGVLRELAAMGHDVLALEPEGNWSLANLLSRSEEHTSELQSLMRISYAVFCLKKKKDVQISLYDLRRHSSAYYTSAHTANCSIRHD